MNVFLVVHPLNYVTAESFRNYVLGPYLEPLEDIGDLDTVWVLWPPRRHRRVVARAPRVDQPAVRVDESR